MDKILFRGSDQDTLDEMNIARKYFTITTSRSLCDNSFVISRYSCLPYYKELERDLKFNNSQLINSYKQYKYIADFQYYEDVKEFTFPTWFDSVANIPENETGPFIVKGKTNSKKNFWNSLMYAKDRQDAIRIHCELMKDSIIGQQGVAFRKYVPLKKLGESGVTGQPFVNEWRFFFYKNLPLVSGFYWSIAEEETIKKAKLTSEGNEFAQTIANIVSAHTNFFCLDIAQKEDGEWILVEINDGQMAGLPINDMADGLYNNLEKALRFYETNGN